MSKPESQHDSDTVGAFLWAVKDHWITLMSGGFITVALALYERWSRASVPTWIYVAILVFFALWACYLAWRDERRKLASVTEDRFDRYRQEFLAERLRGFLARADDMSFDMSNIRHFSFRIGQTWKIQGFLSKYYDAETVERFNKGGMSVLEELLADCYRSDRQAITKRNTNSLDRTD